MSRYEIDLIKQLSDAPDKVAQASIGLRLAAYRARKGQTQSAREIIDSIRREFATSANACIFAQINLSESIFEFYTTGVSSAVQKLRRSRALLAGCLQEKELRLEVSAWMLSYMRILRDWSEFRREFELIVPELPSLSPSTRSRIGLVVADSLQEVADYILANQWYSEARASALECGDDSMFGAALYNRAAIRVYNLRLDAIVGDSSGLRDCKIELEAATARNYSQYINDVGMAGAFELLQGQVALLGGNFVEAKELLAKESVRSLVKEWPSVALNLQADLLLAEQSLGMLSEVDIRDRVRIIIDSLQKSSAWGDVAIAAYSLQRCTHDVDADLSRRLAEMGRSSIERFDVDRANQKQILQALGFSRN